MKIIPKERIKVRGKYNPANKACEVPDDVGKDLVERGKAEKVAGRPSSGGQSGGGKKSQGGGQSGGGKKSQGGGQSGGGETGGQGGTGEGGGESAGGGET